VDGWGGGLLVVCSFCHNYCIQEKARNKKKHHQNGDFSSLYVARFFFLNEFGNYSLYSLSRASLSSLRQVHGAQPVLLVPGRKHGEREHGGSCCALRRVPGQRGKRMGFDFVIKLLPLNLKSTRFVENELY